MRIYINAEEMIEDRNFTNYGLALGIDMSQYDSSPA